MAFPVTISGTFTCAHQGVRPAPAGDAKLTVGRKPVLLFSQAAATATYLGCVFPQGAPPTPCKTTSAPAPNPGAARLLTAGGAPVLLDALRATTENAPFTPPPDPAKTVTVDAGQDKLTAS
ncbi:hypothetical protein [Amycolatopsis vancoresmycina]|uniref:hypothetical protein n=1 Tax=Amycolatopsis vancoresmycina TaxID=208444 RepID=UPI000527EF17|nr:hypothetical protein [Amycolatopsis vancoresmycina]